MFENNAKGWHGSYSVVGRISAEKFHIILMKNEILNEKKRRIKVNTFLFPSDSFEKKNKLKTEEDKIDIFDNIPKENKSSKKEKKTIKYNNNIELSNKPNCNIDSPIYNSHFLHHKEIERQIKKIKEHENLYLNAMKYNPKMEYIYKRVLSGPKWNTISGREKVIRNYNKQKSFKINNSHKIISLKKNIQNIKNINNKKSKKNNKDGNNNKEISNYFINTIIMNKQTARGDLPIYYDHRIRNVKPFLIKDVKKEIENKNNKITQKISENSIKKPKNINNNLRISLSIDNNSNFLLRSNSTKIYSSLNKHSKSNNISLKPHLSQDIKGINFLKTISREQLNFIHRDREGIRPFFMPSYELVEPRCISMVSYAKKSKQKLNINRLKGIDGSVFFDPNKVINKYNNHIETNAPNFNIMVGRGIDNSPLPSYMVKKFDRNSLECITEKGLRMNCYLNSKFNKKFSTFYPKKSFNRLVNNNYLQDEKFSDNCVNYLVKKCFSDKNLRKSIEYYNKDVNYYLEQNNLKRNFDGITFSTYKNNNKKKKDKEFYEKSFDDKYNGFC